MDIANRDRRSGCVGAIRFVRLISWKPSGESFAITSSPRSLLMKYRSPLRTKNAVPYMACSLRSAFSSVCGVSRTLPNISLLDAW